jgi:putative transposase
MARKPRIHVAGGFYHVILRGNARQNIFLDGDDFDIWQSIVRRTLKNYNHRLHAFCWMTNHVHMAMQAGNEPLGRAMSFLASQYARRFNLRHHSSGHLFERRYRAILVQEETYLKELVRYIHRNPVRAGMVDAPSKYKWSSHNIYLGQQKLSLLSSEYVLNLFGTTRCLAIQNYQLFMDELESGPALQALREGGTDQRAAGNEMWLEKVLSEEYTSPSKLTLNDIVSAACHVHDVKEAWLAATRGSHHYSEIRARIAIDATEAGVASISEVARRFNRSPSALSQSIKHLRTRIN